MSFNKQQKNQLPQLSLSKYLVPILVGLFLFIALTNTTFLTIAIQTYCRPHRLPTQ